MNRDVLKLIFEYAQEHNKGVLVQVSIPNLPSPESIINPPENLPEKLAYYLDAYTDDMRHKYDSDIRIVDVRAVDVQGVIK